MNASALALPASTTIVSKATAFQSLTTLGSAAAWGGDADASMVPTLVESSATATTVAARPRLRRLTTLGRGARATDNQT